jgi:hypothetical protein
MGSNESPELFSSVLRLSACWPDGVGSFELTSGRGAAAPGSHYWFLLPTRRESHPQLLEDGLEKLKRKNSLNKG